MAEIILHATPRPPQGTRPARRLRSEGKVPGVVYGLGGDPVTLSVEWRDLRAALVTEQGLNAVIHLEIDGEQTPTLVKEIQRHKVRRDVLHVDFIRVDLNKPVEVEVPIHLEGEAERVAAEDGVVDQVMTTLLIIAKPSDIPSGLTIDISDLEIGSAKRVGDITLPAGVETHVDAEEAVVLAAHGISEEELEAAAAEVAGEPEEGAEAEAAEGEGEAAEGAEGEGAEGEAGEGAEGDAAAEGSDEG
jgi:large subunit ribosomal protein L25